MIRLTCKCSECDGTGRITDKSIDTLESPCPNCHNKENSEINRGTGKTVIEFKYEGVEGQYTDSDHILYHFRLTGNGIRIFSLDNKTDITESLNPLYLEVIEEKECPICNGVPFSQQIDEKLVKIPCPNCTDGKVEVVTGKYIFKAGLTESE